MKSFRIIFIISFLAGMSSLQAQTVQINFEPRVIDFPQPVNVVYSLKKTPPYQIFDIFYAQVGETDVPIVLRTPVCYTAFFCKMEVTTQKAFGIMLKVHAGDYDSYMDQKIPR